MQSLLRSLVLVKGREFCANRDMSRRAPRSGGKLRVPVSGTTNLSLENGSMTLLETLADFAEIDQYGARSRGLSQPPDRRRPLHRHPPADGLYGQRQEGVNMLRVKIPGGRLTAGAAAHDRRRAAEATRSTTSRMSPPARTSRSTTSRSRKHPAAMRDLARAGSPRAKPAATRSATSRPARWPACARASTPTSTTICRRRCATSCAIRSTSSCRASSRSASPAASRIARRA